RHFPRNATRVPPQRAVRVHPNQLRPHYELPDHMLSGMPFVAQLAPVPTTLDVLPAKELADFQRLCIAVSQSRSPPPITLPLPPSADSFFMASSYCLSLPVCTLT